ncbi:hypothetical protein EVAR_48979_1 [Eumeta japonica]|uniref:Uncharacterized protein n=1 Tax=Eumeta variegata TaxID=151549 RepID=A0A4C2A0B9_EUMVA|nr:hypothetical protein EVAR_48979_1 [Eumeta japonica]
MPTLRPPALSPTPFYLVQRVYCPKDSAFAADAILSVCLSVFIFSRVEAHVRYSIDGMRRLWILRRKLKVVIVTSEYDLKAPELFNQTDLNDLIRDPLSKSVSEILASKLKEFLTTVQGNTISSNILLKKITSYFHYHTNFISASLSIRRRVTKARQRHARRLADGGRKYHRPKLTVTGPCSRGRLDAAVTLCGDDGTAGVPQTYNGR